MNLNLRLVKVMYISVVLVSFLSFVPLGKAASYWVTLSNDEGEIAQSVNGFSWHTYGGSWKTYGGHCDANPGASFVAGAYCILRFDVPAGLTAGSLDPSGGGVANGTYRVGVESFLLRTSRPGGNPSYVSDASSQRTTHGPYRHGWGILGSYVETGLVTTKAVSTTGTLNTWFHHDNFTVLLNDPSSPTLSTLQIAGDTSSGWRGSGCHAVNYGWSDQGSQLWSASLTDLSNGATLHSWQASPSHDVVTSGVGGAVWSTCISASVSGSKTLRTVASDRSGNVSSHDTSLYFDVTAPSLGVLTANGVPLNNGDSFNSDVAYKPTITIPVSDAHSGVSSASASFAGVSLTTKIEGGNIVVTPSVPLTLGTHSLVVSVSDKVGNASSISRTLSIIDNAPPRITVTKSIVSGSNEPILDLEANDDRSGITASSWRVEVNGVPLTVSGNANTLNVSIGRVVDGVHNIDVYVKDTNGNQGSLHLTHTADGSADVPQLSGDNLTGIYLYSYPTTSTPGKTHRVLAVISKNGRPVSGRAELRKDDSTVAFREIENDGTVDLAVTINDVVNDLSMHGPNGAGLASAKFTVKCDRCASNDPRPSVPVVDAAGNGIVGPTINTAQPITPTQKDSIQQLISTGIPAIVKAAEAQIEPIAAALSQCSVITPKACAKGYPQNVIYYIGKVPYWNGIPLAESGAALDSVAPKWILKPVHKKSGVLRKNQSLQFKLWTNEISILSIQVEGYKKVTSIGVRKKWRTITINWNSSSKLGKRVKRTKLGTFITIRMKVIATDRNENSSKPKWITVKTKV